MMAASLVVIVLDGLGIAIGATQQSSRLDGAAGSGKPVAAMASRAPPPPPPVEPPPDGFLGGIAARELPDMPGRERVQRTCTRCHTADRIIDNRRTEEAWGLLVEDKYGRGYLASLGEDERAAIIDYLARALGRG